MSQTPSININLDKEKLIDKIKYSYFCAQYARYMTGGGAKWSCENGWLVYEWTSGWPKVEPFPVYVPYKLIDNDKVLVAMIVMKILKAGNAYLFFNEPAPSYAGQVEGFYMSSTKITVRSPETPTANSGYSTDMNISDGDLIYLVNAWGVYNNQFFHRFIAGTYNWSDDSHNKIIDAYVTKTPNENLRYFVVIEPDGDYVKVAVTPIIFEWLRSSNMLNTTGGDAYPTGYIQRFKEIGLGEPPTQ